jgi:hypothetical protein
VLPRAAVTGTKVEHTAAGNADEGSAWRRPHVKPAVLLVRPAHIRRAVFCPGCQAGVSAVSPNQWSRQ